jgi:hypothetical protein
MYVTRGDRKDDIHVAPTRIKDGSLYSSYMYLPSEDVLRFAGAVSIVAVSGFICWVLYEVARMLRQANDLLQDTREKIDRVEQFVSDISDRVRSASQYLGVMASAGKEVFGWMHDRRAELDGDDDANDEDWAEAVVKRKRRKS